MGEKKCLGKNKLFACYKQRFTDEAFTVARVSIPRNCSESITYVLHAYKVEEILGRFYASELVAFMYDEERHRGRQQVGILAEGLVNWSSQEIVCDRVDGQPAYQYSY